MSQLPLPGDATGADPGKAGPPMAADDKAHRAGPIAPDPELLAAIYVLEGLKGFGPQKFKELREHNARPQDALANPSRLPTKGKRGDELRAAVAKVADGQRDEARSRAEGQLQMAEKLGASILTLEDPEYPPNVYASNNPVPVLYVRGSLSILQKRDVVACVGSRKLRPPYHGLLEAFARTAGADGYLVASGFALGADTVGHRSAWQAGGATVAVMPGGLHQPFPPENKDLWHSLLDYPDAAFVSEFAFNRRASSLTLRKRNKLIVAFALGVLVAQSAAKGGAMNAFRFAIEQHKPVATFGPDGTDDTSGNAQIGDEPKARPQTFPASAADEAAFRQWLHAL